MDDESATNTSSAEIPDTFYFESDHLALRGNHDYRVLIRTLAVLEAQRIQAIKDIDQLVKCEREALADPIGFVERLQQGDSCGIPTPINVTPLPEIRWEDYLPAGSLNFNTLGGISKPTTRHKGTGDGSQCSDSPSPAPSADESSQQLVRGRVKGESKPASFNRLWTGDEQKKLEELLIKYPPEEVEARRWAKIARELTNRTEGQVASRCQKYFIKLSRAGLPVPGRVPNLNKQHSIRPLPHHRHQRNNHFYFKPSTFLTSYDPPVYMADEDHDGWSESGPPRPDPASQIDVSDEEDVPIEQRSTPAYAEIMRLKRMKRRRLLDEGAHVGYRCDSCGVEPIVGTRWHCTDCPSEESADFCDMCSDCGLEFHNHRSYHRLEPMQTTPRDQDYAAGAGYLDPNFMPAT